MPHLPAEKFVESDIPVGFTHSVGAPCPFADDDPLWLPRTCCSLRGHIIAGQLKAFGKSDEAGSFYSDMTSAEAIAFAQRLRNVADDVEKRYAKCEEKPHGAVSWVEWNEERGEWDVKSYSTFEEALTLIRRAADWYEKVGELGFCVYASY